MLREQLTHCFHPVTLQVKITVLEDNDPFAQYHYLVTVFTGHRRGAATTSKVSMALYGEAGSLCTYAERWMRLLNRMAQMQCLHKNVFRFDESKKRMPEE